MFVDAEQTYFQGAIRRITVEMQRAFNKNECTVMNTYQNYLKVSWILFVFLVLRSTLCQLAGLSWDEQKTKMTNK